MNKRRYDRQAAVESMWTPVHCRDYHWHRNGTNFDLELRTSHDKNEKT